MQAEQKKSQQAAGLHTEQPCCLCVTDCSKSPQCLNEGAFTPAVLGAFQWKSEANGSKLQAACYQNTDAQLDQFITCHTRENNKRDIT